VVATDKSGVTVEVEEITLTAQPKLEFSIYGISHQNGSIAGAEYILEPDNTTTYSANKLYNFGPIDVNASDIRNAPGGSSSVTYTIEGAPPGFFIDPPTGEIQGSATAPGSFAMVIYGVDKSGAKAVAEAIEITLKYDDVAIPANGPNGEACMNGGTPEDTTPFDQEFTCDCGSTQFSGDNCKDVRACDGGAFGSDNVCRRFQLVTEPRVTNADAENVRYINPDIDDDDSTKVTVGELFRIAGRRVAPETNVSSGNASDITFSLVGAPEGFYVNSQEGTIQAQFGKSDLGDNDEERLHTFQVVATDKSGVTVEAEEITLTAKPKLEFSIHSISHKNGSIAGAEYILEPDNATTYSVNKLYNFGPIDVNASGFQNAVGGSKGVTYTIKGAPPGFFVDPPSGEIQGSATAPGNFTMVIYGVDQSGVKAVAEEIEITLEYDDVDIATYGPNNETCMNGGKPVDATPFDRKFSCNCSTTRFVGSNCDELLTFQIKEHAQYESLALSKTALTWNSCTKWSIDEPYAFQPVNVSNAELSDGTAVDVSTLRYTINPSPGGLLIDPDTGFAQFR
jgi:hypothetical protein